MDLHRVENNKPDWENIPESKHNAWQKLASKTNSILTPGNIVTSAGLGLVTYGSTKLGTNLIESFVFITGGRAADPFDGYIANKTGTKSPLGEIYDATADKIEMVVVGAGIIENNLIPLPIMLGILVQNGLNTFFSIRAKKDKSIPKMHPSRLGKYATASQWATIGLYGISTILEQKNIINTSHIVSYLGDASLVPTTITSISATYDYSKSSK